MSPQTGITFTPTEKHPRFQSRKFHHTHKLDQNPRCCQWKGVTCDQNGRVSGLNLSSESITSGIDRSSALFSLRYLETLNLAYKSLNSTPIPSNVGDLTNLRDLNLSNSGFSGQIPVGLSLLSKLVTLYFPGTRSLQIENPNLSTLIGNLSGVEELHL
ncbi:hypothetical protein RHMOL_Rhmol05G0307200 [Rhododendron molle]|uniref:Uncharacterized protein n=1 Tax=Rhododendron molle TaxID=49168 RepID=A0ACC0NUZ6_RHOML|nr:hypothetical protein RHMOL_Rhmol05G0307200 [Rhododendron molle]